MTGRASSFILLSAGIIGLTLFFHPWTGWGANAGCAFTHNCFIAYDPFYNFERTRVGIMIGVISTILLMIGLVTTISIYSNNDMKDTGLKQEEEPV